MEGLPFLPSGFYTSTSEGTELCLLLVVATLGFSLGEGGATAESGGSKVRLLGCLFGTLASTM